MSEFKFKQDTVIIGVDPGETTGLAVLEFHTGRALLSTASRTAFDKQLSLWEHNYFGKVQVFGVVEQYASRTGITPNKITINVCEGLKFFFETRCDGVFSPSPSTLKNAFSNLQVEENLENFSVHYSISTQFPGYINPHVKDACRAAFYGCYKLGIKI